MSFDIKIQRTTEISPVSSRIMLSTTQTFVFSSENFRDPQLPAGLQVLEVPVATASNESLSGYGCIVNNPNDFIASNKTFEIVKWPQPGWRQLDPDTGDEAGTTEGNFNVHWVGDYYYGENLAIATSNNTYLDGLAVVPEIASHDADICSGDGNTIHLWMSDYHPGMLFNVDNFFHFN